MLVGRQKNMKILLRLVLLALVLSAAACGQDDDTTGSDPDRPTPSATTEQSASPAPDQPVELVSWSESAARDQAAWLRSYVEPQLIAGARIEQFVSDLPGPFAGDPALADIDAATTSLLVAGFSECANAGGASIEDDTVTYLVRKTGNHQCVWAPIRVQVFAVPAGVTLTQ